MKIMLLATAVALVAAVPAAAQSVDGVRDASYGDAKSTVTYNPALASNDFFAPTPFADATGYSIYLTSDADAVYGFLQADSVGAGSYANLYFDLNPSVGNGSDLGFEITNGRAFSPGFPGYSAGTGASPLAGLAYAISADGTGIEFSIANSLFTSQIAGLDYSELGSSLPTIGSDITLRLSQSFNNTVAGGPVYGANRLGSVTLGGNAVAAVPEPASWAMMIGGFGLVGGAMRRRKANMSLA